MLRRFFASSKPINLVVIAALSLLFLIIYFSAQWVGARSLGWYILIKTGIAICFLVTIAVVDFVVKKNGLTKKNTYAVYAFALFSLAFPSLFTQYNVLMAGLFIMLALRRTYSLRSKIDTQKKIFDAAFWIFIASLFYTSAVLFLAVLYCSILFYCAGNYRHWLIPVASLIVVGLLCTTYALYTDGIMPFIANYLQYPSYNFTAYSKPALLIPLSFLAAVYLWTSLKYVAILNTVGQRHKPSYALVIITTLTALAIAVGFAPVRDGSEFYFLLAPLAIISSRYIEKGKSKWFNEILLALFLILPVSLLILYGAGSN